MMHGANCSCLFMKNQGKEALGSTDCSCCDAEMRQQNHPLERLAMDEQKVHRTFSLGGGGSGSAARSMHVGWRQGGNLRMEP